MGAAFLIFALVVLVGAVIVVVEGWCEVTWTMPWERDIEWLREDQARLYELCAEISRRMTQLEQEQKKHDDTA